MNLTGKKWLFTALTAAGAFCTASAIIDNDFDEMSDVWEAQYGLSITDDGTGIPGDGPNADPDGDGWTNLQESIAGTNPHSGQPPTGTLQTHISQSSTVPGVFVISWPELAGKQYTLMVSSNLEGGSWTQVGEPNVSDGTSVPIAIDLTGNTPIPSKLFWRVSVADVDGDNDGLSDFEESVIGTNPVLADTDGDGDPDGEEIANGVSPLDANSYVYKVVESLPHYQPTSNFYPGHMSGSPVVLYFNHPLPTSVTALPNNWLKDLNGESPVVASGTTTILPGRKAVAFVPSSNAFPVWPEGEGPAPTFQIDFSEESTGITQLVRFTKGFSITTAVGSADSGPWVGDTSPAHNFIDAACGVTITAKWSEPLDPATIIPANVTLIPEGGSPISCAVSFDYSRGMNRLSITPGVTLTPATNYTVTLGTGFQSLTAKAHAQAISWSFTTRPNRPTPTGSGPYVVSVSPADFSFGIADPSTVSIAFSEAMDAAMLTAENIHLKAGIGPDLEGTFTYTAASQTLEFTPTTALSPSTYFTLTLDLLNIFNAPASGTPIAMQGNGTFVFSIESIDGGGSGGGPPGGGAGPNGGTSAPASIAPLALHYSWGEIFDFDGDSGCSVNIKLIDKIGLEIIKTLAPNTESLQAQDSGPIDPATTVVITPTLVPGFDQDQAEEAPENGIYVRPSDGALAPGMTYLVFRKTPAASGSSDPAIVEYLGPFVDPGATVSSPFSAQCADALGRGPQSLYLVPVPIMRKIPADFHDWTVIEKDYAKALPGQKMNLRLEDQFLVNYGPGGVTLDNFQWTIPNKNFKDYTPDSTNSHYTDVPAAELTGDREVHFYWTDSGEKEPSVDYQVNISAVQAGATTSKAKINLDKVESKFTTIAGSVKVASFPSLPQSFGFFGATDLFYGVRFVGEVTTPSSWPLGKWNWVQLITSKRTYNNDNGSKSHIGDGLTKKIDFRYPYFPNPPDSAPTDGASVVGMGDSPSNGVITRTKIEVSESFETYQMFCPPGLESRYVPLRKISWHWGGAVTSADSWTTITSPVATVDATGAECSEHPKWSANSNLELEIVDTPPSP